MSATVSQSTDIKKSLIDVEDSVLIVIDIQDSFLEKYCNSVSKPLLEKSVWMIKLARAMGVPIVAMAEDIQHAGTLNQDILSALPEGVAIFNKNSFGLAGQAEIFAEVEASGRGTAILIGTETDVCVCQSALGLIEKGFRVVVLKDAVATTVGDEGIGLNRMCNAGAAISSVKATTYEWLRSVSKTVDLFEDGPQQLEQQVPGCLQL
jgi:nicotinamidase-related amidase